MKRIIITAILAAICTVGGATSFVMNDLPSYTAWKQDNAQQFKKTPKYDGIDQQKDKYYDNDKDYKKVNDHKDDKDHKDYKNKKDKKDKKDKNLNCNMKLNSIQIYNFINFFKKDFQGRSII